MAPLGTYISKTCYDLINIPITTTTPSTSSSSSSTSCLNNNIQQITEINQQQKQQEENNNDILQDTTTMIIDNNNNIDSKYCPSSLLFENQDMRTTTSNLLDVAAVDLVVSDKINDNNIDIVDTEPFSQMLHVYHHFPPTNCQSKAFTLTTTTAADTYGTNNNQSNNISKGIVSHPYNRVNNLVIDSNSMLICKTNQNVELNGDSLVQVPLDCSILNSAKRFYDNKISTL